MKTLTAEQFNDICDQIFNGSWGWKSKLARFLEVSPATITQISTGSHSLSHRMYSKFREFVLENGHEWPGYEVQEEPEETNEQILTKINEKFQMMERMIKGVTQNIIPSIIISGPPGIGKSYPTKQILEESEIAYDQYVGGITAAGLYEALYEAKDGRIILFDDCDSVFGSEDSLNLLKGALDSTDDRILSWQKQSGWLVAKEVPPVFRFRGSIIFLTNLDFEHMIDRNSRLAPHLSALMSRCLYLSFEARTRRAISLRIIDLVHKARILHKKGFSDSQVEEMLAFIDENKETIKELSLRTPLKLAQLYSLSVDKWKEDAIKLMLR